MNDIKPLAESDNFIVLSEYEKKLQINTHYQSENELENEMVQDLISLGYEYVDLKNYDDMLQNVQNQLEALNNVRFNNDEWTRFVKSYLDKPSDSVIEKTKKIHEDSTCDFVFDDGHIRNIHLLDKENISRNKVQVLNQFEQVGKHKNRYDVTVLVNGLPLVHIELKRRGVSIREAFNQIHRYSKESFNSENSLYRYLQMFIISNGTDTRYFANTTKRDKNNFDFTMNWAKEDNEPIKDLKDFTATFLQKNTLLNILIKYSVFNTDNVLLIMRPYQIAATERILWKIQSSFQAKNYCKPESGGYIWHSTGSGKTLTSFKAARMATELDFIDKVFFVVDRKDLDYQTMKEYQKFSPDSVNGSTSVRELENNINKGDDNKIIVTTIQKFNNLMKKEKDLSVYNKQVVFIFDECHRSQFGEAQKNIQKKFKRFYQFGFTGTPISTENASGSKTTKSVFGEELHSYVITDAIRDYKVLKFKVDYNNVEPRFEDPEKEQDMDKLSSLENYVMFLHPARIHKISQYILDNFHHKTHRRVGSDNGFNAMFAVSSVDAAKSYYDMLKHLQSNSRKPLKIATIFSFAANEEQDAATDQYLEVDQGVIGEVEDESFDMSKMKKSNKEFLSSAIDDYNKLFKTNFSVDGKEFQNYYRDLAKRVKNKEVDLLIVVGMFLTGFDAPTLNTLFVDKNLRYHGLIQAFSRTNRIYDSTKAFGNIVTFRDLEEATNEAITLFGSSGAGNIMLEKSYTEYMYGYDAEEAGEAFQGFAGVVEELEKRFPDPTNIDTETDKKEYVKLFGEYLRTENILQNYDEFTRLKELYDIKDTDIEALNSFKERYRLDDKNIENMRKIKMLPDRAVQDYRSAYNDIRDWLERQEESTIMDWGRVTFEVDLLKSQEINLEYILEQIFEKSKKIKNKDFLIKDICRIIQSSIGNRAKRDLVVDYIMKTDLDEIPNKEGVIKSFFEYARKRQAKEVKELIESENLDDEKARTYIDASLRRGYASDSGTQITKMMPKMSPLSKAFLPKKKSIFQKMIDFVDKFTGIGGEV